MPRCPVRVVSDTAGWNPAFPPSLPRVVACAVASGTLGSFAFEATYRLVGTALIQAFAQKGPDSIANYAAWHLLLPSILGALRPHSLLLGTVFGILVAVVLRRARRFGAIQAGLSGLAMAIVTAGDNAVRFSMSLPRIELIVLHFVKGVLLGWVAWRLVQSGIGK